VAVSPNKAQASAASSTRRTATDRVYQGVYAAVLERRLEPGTRLREEELAAGFAVSRTVVRQALQRLAQDQVIELEHNRGARVPLLAREDVGHVFEARRVVECEIARRLGGRLSAAQMRELRELADAESAADAAGDAAAAVRLSGDFHRALARMHGNPLFLRLLDGLLPSTSLLMAQYKVGGGPVCVAHRHIDLVGALGESAAAANTEMKRHLAELQASLTAPRASTRPLRDLFEAYRDVPTPLSEDGAATTDRTPAASARAVPAKLGTRAARKRTRPAV
jgi:DNA-binding GntR family transcriptional regulator